MLEELEPWTLEEAMLRKDTSMTVYSTGTARFWDRCVPDIASRRFAIHAFSSFTGGTHLSQTLRRYPFFREICAAGFLQASQFFVGCWWHQIAYGQKTIARDELKLQCRRIRDQSDSFKDLCQTFPRAGFLSKSKQFRVEIIFSNKSKLESLFSWDRMLVFHLRVCQKSGLDFETAECGCNTTGLT